MFLDIKSMDIWVNTQWVLPVSRFRLNNVVRAENNSHVIEENIMVWKW